MADNESLEAKYGRRKTNQTSSNTQTANTNEQKQNNENDIYKYSRKQDEQTARLKQHLQETASKSATSSGKTQILFSEEIKKQEEVTPKNIKKSIEEALSQYNSGPVKHLDPINKVAEETKLVKFCKTVVSALIVLVVLCIVIAIFMKPKINMESGEIIDQINNAENMYYTMYKKYYYFSKTSYDSTLGIDMSIYNYFDSYEVLHNDETGNYEIKLYGATNAFTIVYYTIKSYLK